MSDLQTYLEAKNAEHQAWLDEDPDNRWVGMVVTDPEFWANIGITTVEEYEATSLRDQYSDMSKDAYGVRLSCEGLTDEEIRRNIDRFGEMIEDQENERRD